MNASRTFRCLFCPIMLRSLFLSIIFYFFISFQKILTVKIVWWLSLSGPLQHSSVCKSNAFSLFSILWRLFYMLFRFLSYKSFEAGYTGFDCYRFVNFINIQRVSGKFLLFLFSLISTYNLGWTYVYVCVHLFLGILSEKLLVFKFSESCWLWFLSS